MYLKRIEIQGFKSFAARTVFEFGPGITAIVGPNGSGKSNVSDAIRWVLGEQSPRVLRLRRAEDALYAGGQKRAPAGLAEVSLWLDNSEGWLPVAYNEVVVTRRLHRSGESEYLINRSRVRLRDIADLFLRARVGQNSYALMGQGLVDQVLSLRPDERRRLLDEAADVRRYQVRIDEAQSRLATTRENLEKVDLIIAEIAPRLTQLERAARRAHEYERLAEELAEALNGWYSAQWRRHEEALVAARAAYDQHSAALAAAVAEADQLDSRLTLARRRVAEQRAAVEQAESQLRDLREQVRAAEQRRALEAERLGFVRRRLDELRAEIADLEHERAELRQALTSADPRGSAEALAAARREMEERSAELALIQAEAERARRAAAEAEQHERRAAGALREAEDALARLDRDIAAAERQQPALRQRLPALLVALKDIGRETLAMRRAAALAAEDMACAGRERDAAVHQLSEAREAAATAARALRELRHTVEERQHRAALLERLRDQARGIDRAAQVVLDAATDGSRPERPAVVGLLADLVHVAPGVETAIEAALADRLTAVVLSGLGDLPAALRALDEAAVGRATLLPLDGLRLPPPLHVNGEAGVVGVAARLVTCEPRYRNLVDALLGRTLVVADLATAQTMVQRDIDAAVTLDGVVLRPSGSVTAGRSTTAQGRFAVERELQALAAEVDRLLDEQAEQQAQVAALAQRERALEAEAGAAAERVSRAERAHAEAATQLLALKGRLTPIRDELRYVRGALAREAEKRAGWVAQRDELERRRTAAAQDLVAARAAARTARRAAEGPAARREALTASLAEARGAVAALEREQASLAELRRSRQAAIQRLDERVHARRREAEARASEIAAVEAERAGLDEGISALAQRIEAAEAALAPAREQLRVWQRELDAIEPAQAQFRARLAELERRALVAENEVHRRLQDLDRLREEMIDEGFLFEDGAIDGAAPGPARPLVRTAAGPRRLDAVVAERVAVADPAALHERVRALRARIRGLGAVNTAARAEYEEVKQRHDFLAAQVADLREAEAGLLDAIAGLRRTVQEKFAATFTRVNEDFGRYFRMFFGGGSARLTLTESDVDGEEGIEIEAQPPGKRLRSLTLLSGGERSMTAVALLFALLESNPAPFCVLDEVDAALDEANISRFGDALKDLAARTQFVVITHNRGTIQAADTIYGVSMNTDGVSHVLSLRLADVPE